MTDYGVVYLHPGHHAGYYPGATPIHLKLIYSPRGRPHPRRAGRRAGGVDKRIDVIATMIQMRGTVHDLAEVELCYAPQFGAAKDPVNVAGMMAANALRGDMPLADWSGIGRTSAVLLDVREPDEFARGHLEGAVNLPLSELRRRIDDVPRGTGALGVLRSRPARLLRPAIAHAAGPRREESVRGIHDVHDDARSRAASIIVSGGSPFRMWHSPPLREIAR